MVDEKETPGPVAIQHPPSSLAATVAWWAVTLLTLVVIDDLTFGPFFWVVARLKSPWAAFFLALAIYVPVQMAVVWRGTSGSPGRIASFFLDRLKLRRRSAEVRRREARLRDHVRGTISSCLLALVIGGVLPPMLLWRAGYPSTVVRRISVLTSIVYAIEFACLHGLVPGLV
jgi:hypothetical protein